MQSFSFATEWAWDDIHRLIDSDVQQAYEVVKRAIQEALPSLTVAAIGSDALERILETSDDKLFDRVIDDSRYDAKILHALTHVMLTDPERYQRVLQRVSTLENDSTST